MSEPLGKMLLLSGAMIAGVGPLVYYGIQNAGEVVTHQVSGALGKTKGATQEEIELAVEQLRNHPEALEALGRPLNIHHLQLTDRHNFVDIADAKLKIPVSGSKSEGHLYVYSSREGPFRRWHLQEVFLELSGGQQIPVFKLGKESGGEFEKE